MHVLNVMRVSKIKFVFSCKKIKKFIIQERDWIKMKKQKKKHSHYI